MVPHQDLEPPPEQYKMVDVPLDDTLPTESGPQNDLEQTDKDTILTIVLSHHQ